MSVPLDAMDVNWVYSKLSELCDGGLAAAEASEYWTESIGGVKIIIYGEDEWYFFNWWPVALCCPYFLCLGLGIESSKAYSRSSLDFRDIYVAVVLFLGAYVWIKFREVALRGVHKRVYKHGRTPKVVYAARLTPPKWNGQAVPKLELGQFATEQEAHTKFRIAAFYYNRDAGLLDGWFQVPPMSEEERSLTGLEFREWVTVQAKKVYEDFQKKEAALMLQEFLEDEDMAKPDDQGLDCASQSFDGMHQGVALSNGHSLGFEEGSALPVSLLPTNTESGMSVNGSDHWDLLQTLTSEASLLKAAEHHLPLLGSQAEDSRMAIAMQPMLAEQGVECASQSFGRLHQGFVTSTGHNLGFQGDSAMPISQLPPHTQSGMDRIDNSNQLNFLQIVHNQQELITYLQQRLQELGAQVSVLQNQQHLQQQLQVINEEVPGFQKEMDQSMPQ